MWKNTRRESILQIRNEQEIKTMEKQEKKWMQLVEYIINKLTELKLKAEFEDRQRGKVRYVSKRSAYQDIINLLEELYERNEI